MENAPAAQDEATMLQTFRQMMQEENKPLRDELAAVKAQLKNSSGGHTVRGGHQQHTARADLTAKDAVETRVKIGVKAEAADGTGATVGPQALIRALEDIQAERSAEAQVRPVQRKDINRHLRIKRRTDHGSHHQAA